MKMNLRLLVCILWLAIFAPRAFAALLGYEGFNYPPDSNLSSQSGGTGWAGAWGVNSSCTNIAGSLTYTDPLGNTLNVSGNSMYLFGGAGTANVSIRRTNSFTRGSSPSDPPSTTWLSLLARRAGNDIQRAASFQIATNNNSERLAVGKGTISVTPPGTWSFLHGGDVSNSSFSTNACDVTTFLVIRLDHNPAGNDDAYLFVNPVLSSEPALSDAAINYPGTAEYGFTSVRLFVGYSSPTSYAELAVDEIRIGESYADVTPFTPGVVGPPRPRWTTFSPSGNSMSLTLTGGLGSNYVIEASANVGSGTWSAIGNLTLNGSGQGTFVDTNAIATNAIRFYRARSP
jgi:hypothetical protein